MTSKYAEKRDWQKQYYFPIPKDKNTGLNTKEEKISAIALYNITPELPFEAIHKCLAYLDDEIMHEFFLAERNALIHPLIPMKVYEKYR